MSRWVLGLNLHHDASACLTRDGVPVVALAEERLRRVKHATFVSDELVTYCLDAAGIGVGDLDLVVLTSLWLPVFLGEGPDLLWDWYDEVCRRELGAPFRLARARPPVVALSHHLAHAYAAFGASGWEEAAVLVVDWAGSCRMDLTHPSELGFADDGERGTERERVSLYHFESRDVRVVEKQFSFGVEDLNDYRLPMPLSAGIGGLYEVVGQFLFGRMFMAGKVMGLAPYGRPDDRLLAEADEHGWFRPRLDQLRALVGRPVPPDDVMGYADLAASAQATLEHHVMELVGRLHQSTGSPRLAYSGGVALNCVLNSRLEREGPFQDVFVVPASNDTGAALGAALYGDQTLGAGAGYRHRSDYLGREYSPEEMLAALQAEEPLVTWRHLDDDELFDEVARLLAEGNVVGWFQGGSELGPRALGNRSILADARDPAMKDILNKKVKHREPFRPFGPLVLADRAAEVFELDHDRERAFMLHAESVRPEWRDRIPSAVHVDGSARLQTVAPSPNPRLFALLSAFARVTGVPVLINTSMNIRGEPIVERPQEAVDIVRRGNLDALVLGNLVAVPAQVDLDSPEIAPRVPRWRDGSRVVERTAADKGAMRTSSRVATLAGRPGVNFNLGPEAGVLDLVDGVSTVGDILHRAPGPLEATMSQLGEYLRLGLLTLDGRRS